MTSSDTDHSSPKKLSLCLSGGGFRATFFHLGLIALLRTAGLLSNVTHICAVSGGSILAAHLVQNWARYNGSWDQFERAAREVIEFGQIDLRGRIVRRWLLGAIVSWIPLVNRYLQRTRLLERYYTKRLYRRETLKSLDADDAPNLYILSTSMTTGNLCAFNKSGMSIDSPDHAQELRSGLLPLGLAVAASSAFPPLFPPLRITRDQLDVSASEFPYEHDYLTDGGVFDNLGIRKLHQLIDQGLDTDIVILSDASSVFDWDTESTFSFLPSRTVRATDILMKRVGDLEAETTQLRERNADITFLTVSIDEVVPWASVENALDEDLQKKIAKTRTDLDRFSDVEIECLTRHGYEVALTQLQPFLPDELDLNPTAPFPTASRPQSIQKRAQHISKSRDRRLGLWNPRDPASWGLGFAVTVLISIFILPLYFADARLDRASEIVEQNVGTVPILFATSREPAQVDTSDSPNNRFTGIRSNQVVYGTSTVTIPLTHKIGETESTNWWFQIEDPLKHVRIKTLAVEEPSLLFPIAQNQKDGVLLFVPGFNETFDDSIRNLATLAYDLNYRGVPFLYSWPSRGELTGYFHDEAEAIRAEYNIYKVLVELSELDVPINIVAIGLGARPVVAALASDYASTHEITRLEEVILIAPDMGAELFEAQFAEPVRHMARRITIYATSNDDALKASHHANDTRRLGFAHREPIVGSEIINFDSFGFDRTLISDIHGALNGTPSTERDLAPITDGLWRLKQ